MFLHQRCVLAPGKRKTSSGNHSLPVFCLFVCLESPQPRRLFLEAESGSHRARELGVRREVRACPGRGLGGKPSESEAVREDTEELRGAARWRPEVQERVHGWGQARGDEVREVLVGGVRPGGRTSPRVQFVKKSESEELSCSAQHSSGG